MSSLGQLESEVKALPAPVQPPLLRIVRVLAKETRFGHPDADQMATGGDACENLGGAFLQATTPSVADTEFSIAHSFGRTP